MSDETLTELKSQHKLLTKEIKQLQANPCSDSLQISELKREKLAVKQKIQASGGMTSGMAKEAVTAARRQSEEIDEEEESQPADNQLVAVTASRVAAE